ncbi:MAG: glycoside hydrolase, partial [Planctomycetota bacterium]
MLKIRVQDLTSRRWNWLCCYLLVLVVGSSGQRLWAVQSDEIILSNEQWSVKVSPGTLEMTAELPGGGEILLSKGSSNLGAAGNIIRKDHQAQWLLETKALKVDVALHQKDLSVRLLCEEVGTFTWPILQKTAGMKALIWPRWEGCYIPLDDPRWESYLIEHVECDTLEGLSMPFWGLDCGDFSLTYIVTCPYNNAIRFDGEDNTLRMSFTHEFTEFQPSRESGFVISLGDNDSPVEPARRFRRWLIEQGKFVSMKDKMGIVPKAERLLGAAHVYLWGDGVSTKMLEQFKEHGFDRMRLCLSGWGGIEKRPHVAAQADQMGYLFGTYDSYHSIHDP